MTSMFESRKYTFYKNVLYKRILSYHKREHRASKFHLRDTISVADQEESIPHHRSKPVHLRGDILQLQTK